MRIIDSILNDFFLTIIIVFQQQRHPPIFLGWSILVLPFLPASNVLLTVGFVVAERVLYIPRYGIVYSC